MKILDLLRSASPQAMRIRIIVVILAIVFYCCNSEKQVLKNSDKTQHVVNKWLETHPARIDTLVNTRPGDTVTQLLVAYDTTLVKDTVTNVFTKVIYRTNTITRSIHDTTTVTIRDNRLLIACQNGLAASDYNAKQAKVSADQFKLTADRWKLYFWILIAITIAAGLVLFKLK